MRNKVFSIVLLFLLLFSAACTAQTTPTAAVVEPTTAPVQPTEAPTEAVEPTATAEPQKVDLTVMAAASLTEAFTEIGAQFEAANPGVTVTFNFAGSQQLAEQIAQAAPADVFASANQKQMDAAVESGRVDKDSSQVFVTNRLVMVYPIDNPAGITELKDLSKSGLKLVLAAKEVPVGQYALDFLDKAVEDAAYGADFKDKVLANVVSYEDNVKSVLSKVVLGEADAGIVYSSDVSGDNASKVNQIEIPDALNVIAKYPIATINDSANAETAKAFVEYVLSADGQAVLQKYGFIPAAAASGSASAAASSAGPITVTDALNRTVTLEKTPERITLVGKALFMIADAIYMFPEAGNRITALTSTMQGTGNFLPIIDSNYDSKAIMDKEAGVEDIVATTPDLVILKSSVAETLGAPLEAVNIPVVYLDFETPDQYQRDLLTLGQIFGNTARAEELAKYFTDKTAAVQAPLANLTDAEKPTTLVMYYSDKDGTIAFNVPPLSWMQTQMVEMAGGTPVWKDANLGKGWTTVNLEQIAAWNPDQIFVIAYSTSVDDVIAKLKADPQWQGLKAVTDNHLYGFAKDLYSWDQPDPRWILGLTWMAGKLHPDLYPNLDIKAEALNFYQTLYSVDEATFTDQILPTFSGDIN